MVTGKDVAEEKCHPDLSQSGHASAHDPHPPPCYAPCKIMSWGAK